MATIRLTATPLFICDMRPGFSEDGVELALPAGSYDLHTHPLDEAGLQGFSITRQGQTPDHEEVCGRLQLDGACIGVYERAGFLACFGDDAEAIYEWSAQRLSPTAAWADISHPQAGSAFYVQTHGDCECVLIRLLSAGRPVGLRVVPEARDPTAAVRSWTWISFSCEGLGQAIDLCHDRAYPLEPDSLVDDLLSDLCAVEDDAGLVFLDPASIATDRPIASFRPGFRGLGELEVSYEESRAGQMQRHRIHPEVADLIAPITARSSTLDLAECLLRVFERALVLQ